MRRSMLQDRILMALGSSPASSVAEVARALGANRASVSRSLALLESQNLLERTLNDLHLTTAGIAQAVEAQARACRFLESFRRQHAAAINIAGQFSAIDEALRNAMPAVREVAKLKLPERELVAMANMSAEVSRNLSSLPWPQIPEIPGVIKASVELAASHLASIRLQLDSGFLASFAEQFKRLQEIVDHYREINEQAPGVFCHYGWFLSPSMPVALVAYVVHLAQDGKGREIDRTMCEAYAADDHALLVDTVESWKGLPQFRRRQAIFREALTSHRQRRYNSSILTLCPHIEGVCAEHGRVGPPSRKPVRPAATARSAATAVSQPIDANIFVMLVEGMWRQYDPAKPPRRSGTNRHALLHGRKTRGGTEANSLRLFITLDWFYHLLRPSMPSRAAATLPVTA